MGGIGFPELLIILLVLLLLFGSTKLPKLARSIGQSSKEFKKGAAEPDAPTELDAQDRGAKPMNGDPPTF